MPSRCARWGWVFASKARYGPTPRSLGRFLEPVPYAALGCSPMTSEVGTDLRAVRPRGAGPVVLSVESACPGEWRFFVMFAGAALSEKSPYLGSAWVRLSLW